MKILITGSTGLLGQALVTQLRRSSEVMGLSRHTASAGGPVASFVCDLTDGEATRRVVRQLKPELIIHAQALANVDRCEQEPALAYAQNVQTTANLLQACEERPSCGLVYVSTDYVFNGTKSTPYDEQDAPCPLGVYGSTKLAAEQLVLSRTRTVVVRTSTLFGSGRATFCDSIVLQLKAQTPVEAFVDQVTSPTYTEDLAAGIQELITVLFPSWQPTHPRLYHVVNSGGCSRLAFATRIAELIGADAALIRAIPMAAQRRPAPRPVYSALTTRHLPSVVRRPLPSWEHALCVYLRERHWLN